MHMILVGQEYGMEEFSASLGHFISSLSTKKEFILWTIQGETVKIKLRLYFFLLVTKNLFWKRNLVDQKKNNPKTLFVSNYSNKSKYKPFKLMTIFKKNYCFDSKQFTNKTLMS